MLTGSFAMACFVSVLLGIVTGNKDNCQTEKCQNFFIHFFLLFFSKFGCEII